MDFSILSDDQLLQLLKGAMQEALNRGGAVRLAAEQEVISSQERLEIEERVAAQMLEKKARLERERIERETKAKFEEAQAKVQVQQTESIWAMKTAFAAAIREWGYDGEFELNIWNRGADRRVYFQSDRRGTWKFCLYLIGNAYHPPMQLEGEGRDCWFDDKQEQLKNLLYVVSQHWKGDVQMSNEVGSVAPSKKKLEEYRQALSFKKVTNHA